jgi:hypothetical protein
MSKKVRKTLPGVRSAGVVAECRSLRVQMQKQGTAR